MPHLPAPRPFEPQPRAGGLRRHVWLLPGGLTLTFMAMVAGWAHFNDQAEREAHAATLQEDASSVEAQLLARREVESTRLREVAARLGGTSRQPGQLAQLPEVSAGVDRLWNRLVWVDADKRVVDRVERSESTRTAASDDLRIQARGQAEHLVAPITDGTGQPIGELLARYDMADLLQSTDLGWLNHRYQVGFLSELGEVIASTARPSRPPQGTAFDRPLAASRDVTLRLVPYVAPVPWTRNPRTLGLLGGLLVLGSGASLLLRREIRATHRAVADARNEAAWRQSMEDSSLVGLRARDVEGRILYVNKTLCDMVGYSPEELVGLKPPLPFWPPEAVDAMMARNLDTLAGGAPRNGYETRWRHRDGRAVDVTIYESRLVNAQGRHVGWMGSIVDIGERKRLEEQDRRHTEVLAQHARLNDLGLLASELAHELNQPLTAIVGFSAGLAKAMEKNPGLDADMRQGLEAIQRNARKAGDIVHWIRGQTSRSAQERMPTDLNALIRTVVKSRMGYVLSSDIYLSLRLQDDLPLVHLDSVGMEQVVTNLVRNAAQAVSGLAPGQPRRLSVSSQRDADGWLTVTVADTGPGLKGKTLDELCTTFYTTKGDGLGLGLGICRAIVEAHRGQLSARDLNGGGAEFSFKLPLETRHET